MDAIKTYKSTRQKLFEVEGIQPQSQFAVTNGPIENVHYLKAGAGHPLILLHGGGSHAGEWTNIIKPLSKHYQLYIVDRPGCGLSDTFDYRGVDLQKHAVAFIQSFMDSIGLEKAGVVGQSMGGYFSICFALQYPERVSELLLIGAPAGMTAGFPIC
ncbi:MAG: alpha/beta hydrolase [Balneolaceae bacterium]|nr:alpha/beta hydrolase [Balneolaceae bacterium]